MHKIVSEPFISLCSSNSLYNKLIKEKEIECYMIRIAIKTFFILLITLSYDPSLVSAGDELQQVGKYRYCMLQTEVSPYIGGVPTAHM